MSKRSLFRRPPDENEAAFAAVQHVIEQTERPSRALTEEEVMKRAVAEGKDPLAAALGRRGGLKGGLVRGRNMTPEQRRESAVKAARSRWGHPGDKP